MRVKITFEIPDRRECDTFFAYLQQHPKDIWNYEERVKHIFAENYDRRFERFKTRGLEPNFTAHWTDGDILDTRVARLLWYPPRDDSHTIQYEVTLREGARDPRILVDLLRRCKCVQEGLVGANWKIEAWYQDGWTADAGNDDQLQALLCQLKAIA